METINETFLPVEWIRAATDERPEERTTSGNLFGLNVSTSTTKIGGTTDVKERIALNFTYGNNEITLVQEARLRKKKPLMGNYEEGFEKEFIYQMKVVDHKTNIATYYDLEMIGIEATEEGDTTPATTGLSEHLEEIEDRAQVKWINDIMDSWI